MNHFRHINDASDAGYYSYDSYATRDSRSHLNKKLALLI